MSKPDRNKSRVCREAESLLKATGRPWHTVNGGQHIKLFLDDHFVGVVSKGDKQRHDTKKIAASIRRICKL